MQDIYISTIIDSYNYGTVLQAVATNNVLSDYGRPVFIDYCRPDWTNKGLRDIYLKDLNHSSFINLVRYAIALPQLQKNKQLFRSFITRHLNLVDAEPYLHKGSFDENAIYCVGSDQTWNSELNKGIDPIYTLKNVPAKCKKISFSASFGRPQITSTEAAQMKPLLEQFDAISVRESSSVSIIDNMGIQGAVALKDPVLLCRPEFWKELTVSIDAVTKPYVLIYMLNENRKMIEYAKQLASKNGFTVRIITFNITKATPKGCSAICQPTPEQWLATFRDASYVVTDSFHGTCFSILFEKPMTVFDPPRYSVRLADVLNDFALSQRHVQDINDLNNINIAEKEIDWDNVHILLNKFRQDARKFLNKCFVN